jgi:hypothetical protein
LNEQKFIGDLNTPVNIVIKLRVRICRGGNTKPQQLRRFTVDRLTDRDVASRYYDELESELQGV